MRSLVNLADPVDNIIVELKQASVPAKPLVHPPTPAPSGYLEDRFHHWAFENQYVRVYDVRIPPGETTDLHVQALDSVTVRISGGLVASQTQGQMWTKAERVEPGCCFGDLGGDEVRLGKFGDTEQVGAAKSVIALLVATVH